MQKGFCISERATVRKGEYPAALPRINAQRALRVERFLGLCPGVNTLYFSGEGVAPCWLIYPARGLDKKGVRVYNIHKVKE